MPGTIPSNDPNWLYSTAAQSAAALVAIVGGLLATRLLGLASERAALLRQAADLRAERDPLQARRDQLHASTYLTARKWFRERYVELYVPNRGVLPDDEHKVLLKGATWDDMDEWHRELATEVVTLFDRLDAHPGLGRLSRALLASLGIDTPEFADDVLNEAIRVVNRAMPRKPTLGASPTVQAMIDMEQNLDLSNLRITPQNVLAEQDRELAELAQVDMRLAELNAKVDLNSDALVRVQRPPGVRGGLWALGTFALLGIGLPLILMSVRPVPTGWFARLSVLVAFGAGLALIVGSIAYQALELRRPPTSEV